MEIGNSGWEVEDDRDKGPALQRHAKQPLKEVIFSEAVGIEWMTNSLQHRQRVTLLSFTSGPTGEALILQTLINMSLMKEIKAM